MYCPELPFEWFCQCAREALRAYTLLLRSRCAFACDERFPASVAVRVNFGRSQSDPSAQYDG